MGAFDIAWQVLKQAPNPELARLHQRMNQLIAEFDRLSAERMKYIGNRVWTRELDLQIDQVVTEMHYLEGDIARAEQPPAPYEPYDYDEDPDGLFS